MRRREEAENRRVSHDPPVGARHAHRKNERCAGPQYPLYVGEQGFVSGGGPTSADGVKRLGVVDRQSRDDAIDCRIAECGEAVAEVGVQEDDFVLGRRRHLATQGSQSLFIRCGAVEGIDASEGSAGEFP